MGYYDDFSFHSGFDAPMPAVAPAAIDPSQFLKGYATPEAAQFNLPQEQQDQLTQRYRTLRGDPFADPYTDISAARARARVDAIIAARQAMSAPPAAAGGGAATPTAPTAPAPTAGGIPLGGPGSGGQSYSPTGELLPPNTPTPNYAALNPWAQREVMASASNTAAEAAAAKYKLAGMPIPSFSQPEATGLASMVSPAAGLAGTLATQGNYYNTLKQRANLSGVANEFDEIMKSNPEALRPSLNANPIMLQRTDATGKASVVAGQDLHDIANTPTFQKLKDRNPQKAADLYHAVTGRDFEIDREATAQRLKQTQESEQKAVQDIRDRGIWNPALGRFELKKSITDPSGLGQQKTVYEPLSDYQQGLIDKYGVKHFFGDIDTSKFKQIETPRGLTPEETITFHHALSADLQNNPDKPRQQAIIDAYKIAAPPPSGISKFLQAAGAFWTKPPDPDARAALAFYQPSDVASGVNAASNVINLLKRNLLPSNQFTGTIPNIPMLPSGGPAHTPEEIMAIRAMVDRGNYLGMPTSTTPAAPGQRSLLSYFLPPQF